MDTEAYRIIKEFISIINKKFKLEEVIFFGSRTRDDYLKFSDIDLILVSSEFEGIDFHRRITNVYEFWRYKYPLEVLCYTPSEFKKKKKQITLVSKAVKTGIKLKA